MGLGCRICSLCIRAIHHCQTKIPIIIRIRSSSQTEKHTDAHYFSILKHKYSSVHACPVREQLCAGEKTNYNFQSWVLLLRPLGAGLVGCQRCPQFPMGQDNQRLFACNFLNAGAHHTKWKILYFEILFFKKQEVGWLWPGSVLRKLSKHAVLVWWERRVEQGQTSSLFKSFLNQIILLRLSPHNSDLHHSYFGRQITFIVLIMFYQLYFKHQQTNTLTPSRI